MPKELRGLIVSWTFVSVCNVAGVLTGIGLVYSFSEKGTPNLLAGTLVMCLSGLPLLTLVIVMSLLLNFFVLATVSFFGDFLRQQREDPLLPVSAASSWPPPVVHANYGACGGGETEL